MDNGKDPQTLLVIGAPEHDVAAYHLSGFLAPDPVIYLRMADKKGYLAVSSMEYGRAKREAQADEVLSFDELGVMDLAKELKSGGRALAAATAGLLKKLEAAAYPVAVPPSLGVLYADELRARGLSVSPDAGLFASLRRSKSEVEISYIEKTQRAIEAACVLAVAILKESEVAENGTLLYEGEALTSERLRFEIDIELLRRGCAADGTITAGGVQTADPHERGHGPLKAGETIIIDIFPSDKTTRYYADMTRTFVKGEPNEELQRMYDAVLESQEAALSIIRAGINGREVHKKVSEVLHEKGYKTLLHDQKSGEPLLEGFIHGTGHGVGLEIHEAPRISTADEELVPGDVVTVEPGLYYPELGGVRIEDLVVVTENGCRNLTNFPKKFRV
ncbi:MAG TPA: Xaa-Pro peptidase family protein [Rubrobacteraceae bacterium]|nr:Xaa-Pro peptidase family protein [Rubrobacteraceae bacterium]